MKYDDAEYLFLNFETERDNDDAGTHIGMYLAWAILRGLGGEHFSAPEAASHIQRLKAREITGAEVLWDRCDGKLTDDDLTEIDGRREQLEGKIQERYGYTKDQAKKAVDDWSV